MNSAWFAIAAASERAYVALQQATNNVRSEQEALLRSLLISGSNTSIGKRFDFSGITQSDDLMRRFQKDIPIREYAEIEPLILQQMDGVDALVGESILFYERTGGSSGGSKYIPFSKRSLELLQAAVEAWLFDLVTQRPAVADGPAYWSVSPAIPNTERTATGTPIGAASDLDFMRPELQQPFAQTLVDMSAIQLAENYEQWQRMTLLTLIVHDNIRLISIWSPTFLTALLNSLSKHAEWLINVLEDPDKHAVGSVPCLAHAGRNVQAIARLTSIAAESSLNPDHITSILWPELDTISCWTHGPAAGAYRELKNWFPSTHFQPKGLLATEGVVSVPLQGADYPVLAVTSGVFEFVDQAGSVLSPEELELDADYRVLITNASGLYRYDIGDQVRVRGYYNQAPMLEFIGRSHASSDLVGEKLHDSFVSQCLAGITIAAVLAPSNDHYCLFIESANLVAIERTMESSGAGELNLQELGNVIDRRLCKNPQYAYARELEQLGPVKVKAVHELAREQLEWKLRQGQVLGDIKPIALCLDVDLITHLERLAQ